MSADKLEQEALDARRGVRRAIEHYVRGMATEEEAATSACGSLPRGGLGTAEGVERARVVCRAALEEFELVLPLAVEAGLTTAELRRTFQGAMAGEQAAAEDWFAATGRLRRIRELAGDGMVEQATSAALALLDDTTSGDDRAEQRIVEPLDPLGLDEAIVTGWDLLVVRRRQVRAEGRLQITHAVTSWEAALQRIASAQGPLAAAAARRLSEPFWDDTDRAG